MAWHPKYETGNTHIDNQHKEIFRLAYQVIDASYTSQGDIKAAIDFLTNYTATHFEHEEKLMDESAYPVAGIHKKQHSDFVAAVKELAKRVSCETNGAKNRTDIEDVAINWLVDHVLGSDKVMADHYRKWALDR